MKSKAYYLGIDLGTSSVKGILRSADGETFRAKMTYAENTPRHWFGAVRSLIARLKEEAASGEIAAIGLSSQVGTYVMDGEEVISWQSDAGRGELEEIKAAIPQSEFVREIGMPHPDLISYPLPRLLYIQRRYGKHREVLMPKDLLIRALTGETVTDVFSMRGIADPVSGRYATALTRRLGIEIPLPPLRFPTDPAGVVSEAAARKYGLAPGTPVYLGCNDFFAGLLGMGIRDVGDAFDLSGTSEHIGYLSREINEQAFVSGPYFWGSCSYGGTKSSGVSCDLAMRQFGIDGMDMAEMLSGKPPIFLPYLCGERAPIYDEMARGVYFGLDGSTDRAQLAYAALEGVVFSLYDIARAMDVPTPRRLICGGGSAVNPVMNLLRATLFDCDVVCVREHDTSALGACMLAMTGAGVWRDLAEAVGACVEYLPPVRPERGYREVLCRRFEIYREVYRNLKPTFARFYHIEKTQEA